MFTTPTRITLQIFVNYYYQFLLAEFYHGNNILTNVIDDQQQIYIFNNKCLTEIGISTVDCYLFIIAFAKYSLRLDIIDQLLKNPC